MAGELASINSNRCCPDITIVFSAGFIQTKRTCWFPFAAGVGSPQNEIAKCVFGEHLSCASFVRSFGSSAEWFS
jgi:hypothetical protein